LIPGRKFYCLRFGRADLRLPMGMGNPRPLSVQLVVKPTNRSQLLLGLIIIGAVSAAFHKPPWRVAYLKRTGTASLL